MISPTLTAYLIEDEPLCRRDFRQTLRAFPNIQLKGEADSLATARCFLADQRVDLLFLDLSLGRDNGLDLIPQLSHPPLVIALTAHPQHAARGFDLQLVDYLLKPVAEKRLGEALERVHQRIAAERFKREHHSFVAEQNGQKIRIEISEILSIESSGNYVVFQTKRGKAIRRITLQEIARSLPSELFLTVSRGRMIARHQIQGWYRDSKSRLYLKLASGNSQMVSRGHKKNVLKNLTQSIP